MSDTKVLQAILDGQVQIREDIKCVKTKLGEVENNLNNRIDKLGLQIANLEDDAPTTDEFSNLEDKVKILQKIHPQSQHVFA
jgi:hypothetical protein